MKVKTSVSLSKEVIDQIDEAIGKAGNRSEFIEEAARQLVERRRRAERYEREVAILNKVAAVEDGLEPPDVLDYTAPLTYEDDPA